MNAKGQTEVKLRKPVKEIVAPGCGIKVIEEEDGIILEISPLPPERADIKGGVCAPKFDPFNNFIGCKAVSCTSGCRVCTYDYGNGYFEYYCKCGKCP